MIRLMIATVLASVSVLASVFMSGMAFGASTIDDFAGRWIGETVEASNPSIQPDTIDIEIKKGDGGFELAWNNLTGEDRSTPLKARFTPTSRDGVFEYAPEAGSFLNRMFAAPATGNPLEGETLLWARIETDGLAVYSLTVDKSGTFNLDHYSWTKTDSGLLLHYRAQTEALGNEILIEGRLVPAGD